MIKNIFSSVILCCSIFIIRAEAAQTAPAPTIQKTAPAQRIISLSPHITELIFAAGAGDRLVGVSAYSDYPAAAKQLPIVSSSQQINIETILQLQPDLIVYWQQGNPQADINKLKKLGIPLYASAPGGLEDIAAQLIDIGRLTGTEPIARQASQTYLTKLHQLQVNYKNNEKIRLFYQVWDKPLMTVASDPWLQEQFEICGLDNVFSTGSVPYPVINIEQVLVKQPQVIIAGSHSEQPLNKWRSWKSIPAVKNNQLYHVDPDKSHRFTPRVIEGIQALCQVAEQYHNRQQ